jgi:Xaa-Pro aminopeptidase
MHATRCTLLQQRLADEGLAALLVSHLPNVFYLSAFTGTASSLLLTATERWFIADARYHGRLGTEVDAGWQLLDVTSRSLADALATVLGPGGTRRLAVEAEHLTLAQYGRLSAAGGGPVPVTGWVEALRSLKDPAELALLRRAAGVGAQVFTELLPLLTARTTEADVAAEIEYRARRHGASATSFKPIVASGVRSAMPHAGFSAQPLQPGVPTVIDLGVVLDGYCSDMTRTVFLEACPAEWAERYALVDAARAAGETALRPGATGAQAHAAARDVLAAAGYAAQFTHGLGHGVGVEIHEAPRLAPGQDCGLAAGHVVTVEPGLYWPGAGGIRIENLCAVTAGGAEVLTPLGTGLTVV